MSDLSLAELDSRLCLGLHLKVGWVIVCIKSQLPVVSDGLFKLYSSNQIVDSGYADFHIEINPPKTFRRWYRPQVEFYFDRYRPFKPLPQDQAFAFFEWSFNWCIASYCHQYLILHAAVIEKNGFAAILPAPPGSGKSTLTAGLVSKGWRLFSDELALLDLKENKVFPLPRPISLKNQSIDVMKAYAPGSIFGPIANDTGKGTVGHMKPPADSVMRGEEPAIPTWIIYPKYQVNSEASLVSMKKADAFMHLAENSFNYQVLRQLAFHKLTALVEDCECYQFTYSCLDDALATFNHLAQK